MIESFGSDEMPMDSSENGHNRGMPASKEATNRWEERIVADDGDTVEPLQRVVKPEVSLSLVLSRDDS